MELQQALSLNTDTSARIVLAHIILNGLAHLDCPTVRHQLSLTFAQMDMACTCLKVGGFIRKENPNLYSVTPMVLKQVPPAAQEDDNKSKKKVK